MKTPWFVVSVLVLLSACAGDPPPAPKAAPTAKVDAPRCPPGVDDSPSDAKGRMTSMQADVRKCFPLATGAADSEVKVEVTIGEKGDVRQVTVLGGNADPSGRACFEKTMRAVKFATFCGPDVSLRWTYALR